jgi:ArsR family transcriptional regulator, arsenate/arsenite/antimonite-responsive transcriptional repressor
MPLSRSFMPFIEYLPAHDRKSDALTTGGQQDYICIGEYMKTKAISSVDQMFRAFSDRTRLRILSMLHRSRSGQGELCVCEIVGVLAVPQPKVSRHLAYLRKAGLVEARKDGLWMYYRLASPRNAFHAKLLDCLGCCFEDVPQLAKDAKRLGRGMTCCK